MERNGKHVCPKTVAHPITVSKFMLDTGNTNNTGNLKKIKLKILTIQTILTKQRIQTIPTRHTKQIKQATSTDIYLWGCFTTISKSLLCPYCLFLIFVTTTFLFIVSMNMKWCCSSCWSTQMVTAIYHWPLTNRETNTWLWQTQQTNKQTKLTKKQK